MPVQIPIRFIDGDMFTVNAEISWTIARLIEAIEQHRGRLVQNLVFEGRRLDPTETVGSAQLLSGSGVSVIPRRLGAPPPPPPPPPPPRPALLFTLLLTDGTPARVDLHDCPTVDAIVSSLVETGRIPRAVMDRVVLYADGEVLDGCLGLEDLAAYGAARIVVRDSPSPSETAPLDALYEDAGGAGWKAAWAPNSTLGRAGIKWNRGCVTCVVFDPAQTCCTTCRSYVICVISCLLTVYWVCVGLLGCGITVLYVCVAARSPCATTTWRGGCPLRSLCYPISRTWTILFPVVALFVYIRSVLNVARGAASYQCVFVFVRVCL